MSTLDAPNTNTDTNVNNHSDILVGKDTDGEPIEHDDNDAKILGRLYELSLYAVNKQLFQPTIKHNAVQHGHRLAVDSFNSSYFVLGQAVDNRFTFINPCPPTEGATGRFATYNDTKPLADKLTARTSMPVEAGGSVVLAPFSVDAEWGKFMTFLMNTFGACDSLQDMIAQSHGNGRTFVMLLAARGNAADPADRAVVAATYANHVREGV